MATPSYALPSQGPVMQNPISTQIGSMGTQGGGSPAPQFLQPQQADTSTFDALMKIGGAVLEPIIQQREAEQFLQGAQRVAQGEAVKDIVDEQPWYTSIFGPSSSVRGARTIAQVSQLDKFNQSLYDDMGRLQQLSPDEVGKEVNAKMLTFLTGDAQTDAVLQGKMVETSGTFYGAHTKAHYKWTQETTAAAATSQMIDASGSLQSAGKLYADGTLSEDDWSLMQANAAATVAPLAGESQESYWKRIEAGTIDAMVNGNHHYAGIVLDTVFDKAPAETRKAIADAQHKYEARTLTKVGLLEYSNQIAGLQAAAAAGALSPAQLAEGVVRINDSVRKSTGIQHDMLSRKDLTAMLKSNYGKHYSRNEAAQENAAKLRQKTLDDSEYLRQISTGLALGKGKALEYEGFKPRDVDAVQYSRINAAREVGADWAGEIVANSISGLVNAPLKNEMLSGIRASRVEGYAGAPFQQTYATAAAMLAKDGGTSAVLDYLGEDEGKKMLLFNELVGSRVAPEEAYRAAFEEPIDRVQATPQSEVLQQLNTTVADAQPGTVMQWLGSQPLSEQGQRQMATLVQPMYDVFLGLGYSPSNAMKEATTAVRNKSDVLGAYIVPVKPGEPKLANLLGASEEAAGKLLTSEVGALARAAKLNVDLPGSGVSLADELTNESSTVRSGSIGRAISRVFQAPADVHVLPAYRTDPVTGERFVQYSVRIVADGETASGVIDSRQLRKKYEASPDFKD